MKQQEVLLQSQQEQLTILQNSREHSPVSESVVREKVDCMYIQLFLSFTLDPDNSE